MLKFFVILLISPHLWHEGEGGDGGELGDDEAEDEAGAGPGAVTAHHHRVLVPGGPGQTPQVTLQTQEIKQVYCVQAHSPAESGSDVWM